MAARERAGRMLVLVQGHPEYAPTLLLREYRRDMRRYIEGSVAAPPQIPTSYVDEAGEELLRAVECFGRAPSSGRMEPCLSHGCGGRSPDGFLGRCRRSALRQLVGRCPSSCLLSTAHRRTLACVTRPSPYMVAMNPTGRERSLCPSTRPWPTISSMPIMRLMCSILLSPDSTTAG